MSKYDNIRAVGFDVDQTLYHVPKEIGEWMYEEWLGELVRSKSITHEEAKNIYDERYLQFGSNTATLDSFGLDGQAIAMRLMEELPLEKYLGKDMRLVAMIERLKEKYRLFIISNGTERHVLRKIRLLGLDPSDFDPIVSCYDHPGWTKPNPVPFLHVLEKLGTRPEETLYIGDREETDIAGANAVDMKTIKVRLPKSKIALDTCQEVYDIEQLIG